MFAKNLVISKEITIFVYPLKDGAEEHPARRWSKIKSHKKMKTNRNNCSVYVTFVRGTEVKTIELCGLEAATEYISDVILKNDWKFMGMTRGTEYKDQTILTEIQQEVYNVIRKDAEFYMEQGQFTIEASHFGGLSFKVALATLHELEALGLITLFPKGSCYFDGQINKF